MPTIPSTLVSEVAAVANARRADLIKQDPQMHECVRALERSSGASHATTLPSGTAALTAAFATRVGDSEAITTPTTFAAPANCDCFPAADVRVVDIDLST